MTGHLKALFMLLLIGLVLPVAGMPQRFCMSLLAPGQSCENCGEKTACNCESDLTQPGCIAVVKALPDALLPDHFTPAMPLVAILPSTFLLPDPVEASSSHLSHPAPTDRSPPGGIRLCLLKRSLLI